MTVNLHQRSSSCAITATRDAQALIVRIEGEVDLSSAQRLRDFLLPRLRDFLLPSVGVSPHGEVHLAMAHVSFFDSAGASVLADAFEVAQQHQARIFVRPSRCVARVLTILGMIEAELAASTPETNTQSTAALYQIRSPH